MNEIAITWWDVAHGLSVWIKTPSLQSHWIDAGHNGDTDFCPAEYVKTEYGETSIDYLIVSHPDSDHISALHRYMNALGRPKVLSRNKTLRDDETHGEIACIKAYSELNESYTQYVSYEDSPINPSVNGGIEIFTCYNNRDDVSNTNDASVVAFYKIWGHVFVFPGDISENGWNLLWEKHSKKIQAMLNDNKVILTAPHHGRASGYSAKMFEHLSPDFVIISDKYGKEPTDQRFRNNSNGLKINGEIVKFYSTKTSGRIKVVITEDKCVTWYNE